MISLQYRHFPTSPTLWAFRRSASPGTWCIPRWKRNAGEIYQREQEQRSAQPLLNREKLGMALASPALRVYVVCDNWFSMKIWKQHLRRSHARSARSLLDDGLEQVLPSALARRFLRYASDVQLASSMRKQSTHRARPPPDGPSRSKRCSRRSRSDALHAGRVVRRRKTSPLSTAEIRAHIELWAVASTATLNSR
jgi:hypothetical protein